MVSVQAQLYMQLPSLIHIVMAGYCMRYSKTIDLLLEMTKPIHRTGKAITGDSGFCTAMGVTALQMFVVQDLRAVPHQKAEVLAEAHSQHLH